MKRYGLFLFVVAPCSAFTVNAVSAIPTQAVLQYSCPGTATIAVSESSSLSPLVHDVDPTLFPGSNLDSRDGALANGSSKVFVVGKRDLETSTYDSRTYSRALQQGTTHYYSVACDGVAVTGSFTTKTLPFGVTYSDLFPLNSDGTYKFPSWDMTNRNETMVSADTGVLIKHLNTAADDADLTTSCGSGVPCYNQSSANGMGQYCSDTLSHSVYLCLGGQQSQGGNWPDLYAINPTTGAAAFLGHAYIAKYDVDVNSHNVAAVINAGGELLGFAPGSANTVYFLMGTNGSSPRTTIVKWVYNGDYATTPTNGPPVYAPYVGVGLGGAASGMDMLGGGDLGVLANAFDSAFDNTKYSCGSESVQAGYLLFGCRRGNQGSFAWVGAYNLGNGLPLGSGGTGGVAAMAEVFALPQSRWCTDHGVVFASETTPVLLQSPGYTAGNGVGQGPYQVILGTNMPATTTQMTITVSSNSLVGGHNAACTDLWSAPSSPWVDGEPVSPCADHFLQTVAAGDLFQFPTGEIIQIATKNSPTSWVVNRAIGGNYPAQVHSIGDLPQTQCQAYGNVLFSGIAFTQWNFVNSPHGTEHAGDYALGVGNHSALRGNFNVQGESSNYGFFASPITDETKWGLNYPYSVTSSPTFSGFPAAGGGFQKHPSIASNNTSSFFDSTFFGGEYPTFSDQNNTVTTQVTCSPTCTHVWSYDSSVGTTGVNPKIWPQLAASCGDPVQGVGHCVSQGLVDVSAPGKVLSDSDPDYVYCIPRVNGDCAIGSSAAGHLVYFKMSTFDHANGWCQGSENNILANQNICIGNFAGDGIAEMQYKFVNDATGASSYRPLTRMWGSYNGFANTLKVTNLGEWVMYYAREDSVANTSTVVLLKVPSDPGTDGIDRSNFVSATLNLTAPSGLSVATARVKFWYAEQGGSLANPYCTGRREGCVAVSATIDPSNPFNYLTTDSYSPLACTTSCTIAVPVLPLHTAYYSAEFLNGSGTVVSSTQGVAMENTVVAPASMGTPAYQGGLLKGQMQ